MKSKKKLIGVILCAGKATRLKNFPFNKPKSLLEIVGKPNIEYQLEYFYKAGIKKIIIVVGKNGKYLKEYIKFKNKLNLNIKFIKDTKPKGIGSSLLKIKNYVHSPMVVFLGDIFLYKLDLKKMISIYRKNNCSTVVASIIEKDVRKLKKNFSIHVEKGSVIKKVIEKPQKPKTNLKGIGVYIFSTDVFGAISDLSKNFKFDKSKKELGITEVIQRLIDLNKKVLNFLGIEYDYNINDPIDLWKINFQILKKNKLKKYISRHNPPYKSVKISNSIIGRNVSIPSKSKISKSIIFSDTKLNKRSVINQKIVTSNGSLKI